MAMVDKFMYLFFLRYREVKAAWPPLLPVFAWRFMISVQDVG